MAAVDKGDVDMDWAVDIGVEQQYMCRLTTNQWRGVDTCLVLGYRRYVPAMHG